MTWIIIVLVLLAAFGPVFWLMPSARDRRLNRLRAEARALGLVVDISALPKLNATAQERVSAGGKVRRPTFLCASYGRFVARKVRAGPRFRLLRSPREGADEAPPLGMPGWEWDAGVSRDGRFDPDDLAVLSRLMTSLPGTVVALEVGESAVRLYWREPAGAGDDAVAQLAAKLAEIEDWLCAIEDRLENREEGDIS